MGIFHSYVSLPASIYYISDIRHSPHAWVPCRTSKTLTLGQAGDRHVEKQGGMIGES